MLSLLSNLISNCIESNYFRTNDVKRTCFGIAVRPRNLVYVHMATRYIRWTRLLGHTIRCEYK